MLSVAILPPLTEIQLSLVMASASTHILLITLAAVFSACYLASRRRQSQLLAPGPTPLPILGSLHLMHGFKIPYAPFTALSKVYGKVFSITLGTAQCIVVNDQKSVKEVLSEKDSDFDGRPDFRRFDALFGGDKQNSLAFCDYTNLQTKRRQILRPHTFPHAHSYNWSKLDSICRQELLFLIEAIDKEAKLNDNNNDEDKNEKSFAVVDIKTLVLKACGNIFNEYFCSVARKDYDDEGFTNYVDNFDKVFYEVNNGRAMDFLPWLTPFMRPMLNRMKGWSQNVRNFVEEEIIQPKRKTRIAKRRSSADFLDQLMDYIDPPTEEAKSRNEVVLNKQHALYALEDILGGHCAVGNITLRIFLDLAKNNEHGSARSIQDRMRDQIDAVVAEEEIGLDHKKDLHWITAAANETIRMTCSPIVPHQASRDSTIAGHRVKKDTIVFINNHFLNMSEELWAHPETYDPSRFLDGRTGAFKKPEHFQPFSMGRRSCMGYKIVQIVSFFIVANLIKNYTFEETAGNPEYQLGMLSLPPGPYKMKLTRRQPFGNVVMGA